MSDDVNKVTFVLTGPREGFTGILGKRYGFKDGELSVDHVYRDAFRTILCNSYCCNIKGEAPLWQTVDGASIKITDVPKPVRETTTVKSSPSASTTDKPASAIDSDGDGSVTIDIDAKDTSEPKKD